MPILKIIDVISDNAGVVQAPVNELRFKSPLTVTPSLASDGSRRLEIGIGGPAAAVAPVLPLVPQPGFGSGSSATSIIAVAGVNDSHLTLVSFIPYDALTADDTNYLSVSLYIMDAAGGTFGSSYSTVTRISSGTGDWFGQVTAFAWTTSVTLSAGHRLGAFWTQHGAGVAMPGGVWTIA